MDINTLSLNEIREMDYFKMIGVVKETNRPPGGLKSIRQIALNSFLHAGSKVLEVGTSTGVTAIELAKLTACQIKAIDINEDSLAEGRRRAKAESVAENIDFLVDDASKSSFEAGVFDLVFCGNVTSYFDDKEAVIREFERVLKPNGLVAAIPMYYIDKPPQEVVSAVSEAIGVNITPLYKEDWINYYDIDGFELGWQESFKFDKKSDSDVQSYVDLIFAQPHLQMKDDVKREALLERYSYFMHLFRTNLSHMGYTNLLIRKVQSKDEPELFTSSSV